MTAIRVILIFILVVNCFIIISVSLASSASPTPVSSYKTPSLSRSRLGMPIKVMKEDRIFVYVGKAIGKSSPNEPSASDANEAVKLISNDAMNETLIKLPVNETEEDNEETNLEAKYFSGDANSLGDALDSELASNDQDNTIDVIHNSDAKMSKSAIADPLAPFHVPEGIKIKISDVISDPNEFLKSFVDFDNSDSESDNDSIVVDTNKISVSSLMRGYSSGSSSSDSSNGVKVTSLSDRRKVKLPRISSPAGCATELRTIEIKDEAEDSDLYYPWCVRLPRCSGCCPSTRLKCVPTNTSIVDIVAVKLHYANFNQKFKYEGMRIFKMEQHESCRCECIQQASDCNKYQIYRSEECRCVCNDPVARAEECSKRDTLWNPDTCNCVCKYKHTCTTGTRFNSETCKCEIESHLLASVNELKKISDAYKIPKLSPVIDSEFKKQEDRSRMSNDYYEGINPDSSDGRSKNPFG